MAYAPLPQGSHWQPSRAGQQSPTPRWPFFVAMYASLAAWVPVAFSGWIGALFAPYLMALDYGWGLLPIMALGAAVGMIVIERANGNKAAAPRSVSPYVVIMVAAVVATIFNVPFGVLSTNGLSLIYYSAEDELALDAIPSGVGSNYFWDGPALIQIGCLACSVIALAGAVTCAAMLANTNAQRRRFLAVSAPIGYTQSGHPIYPIVGYTPDGTPVTSDRAVALTNTHTNSLAIVALILGFVFPPAAVPVGHISLSQIKRTGEQGNGLAIGGLVLGYLGVALTIVWIVFLVSL